MPSKRSALIGWRSTNDAVPSLAVIAAALAEMPRRSQALTAMVTVPPALGRLVGLSDGSHTIGGSSNCGCPATSTPPVKADVCRPTPSSAQISIVQLTGSLEAFPGIP